MLVVATKWSHLGRAYWAVHLGTSINDQINLLLTNWKNAEKFSGERCRGLRLISLVIASPRFQWRVNDAM